MNCIEYLPFQLFTSLDMFHILFNKTPMTGRMALSASTISHSSPVLTITRNLLKTHRATYKRWRKTGNGYKRGLSGRKHGNAGWSNRVLGKLVGTCQATSRGAGNQKARLAKLLPNL
ncbi:uncharacterized protein PAS_chr2-2_0368 [Komagataella phaffii GS115]|uniref:Uncharacterized protein n=2 Tax=Komagataella phaffii TaxID=460519 RepID=C4R213_KOMPG|nr:uncharacterized protein PAS_chr2-2_0368 [Komagataella phaffii GS115]AOA62435.1 GQ67_00957T0 [Komagataella phaffii]AOA67067.1 GQ68_00432T0 [Komagataella phaffii GS115]CAY69537.1 Putative protein of unknown function [Komagataella phaffii GS115]